MAQILEHLTLMIRFKEEITESHLQPLQNWKHVEQLFWYAIDEFQGSRTQSNAPPLLLFQHYIKVKPSWHVEIDLIMKALLRDIPFDLVAELLSRLPLQRGMISSILQNMITAYLTAPLDQGHLLMNIEVFFQHNVSNYLQISTLNRLFFLAAVNVPSCNALATMIKSTNYHLQYSPLLDYARQHQRRDIINLVSVLFDLGRSESTLPDGQTSTSQWIEYIRHMFDETRSEYCTNCIQNMIRIYRKYKTEMPCEASYKTIRDFFFDKQKQFRAMNVTDVFTMEKIENIPYVFAYTLYCEKEVYIFDLPNLLLYIKETSNKSKCNPYTRESFGSEEIQLINQSYFKLLKAYGNLSSELCVCKR